MTLPISSCSHRLLQSPPSRSATLRWSSEDRRDPRDPRDPQSLRRGRRWQRQTLIPGPERRWKRWEWTWRRRHHWGLRICGLEMCTVHFKQKELGCLSLSGKLIESIESENKKWNDKIKIVLSTQSQLVGHFDPFWSILSINSTLELGIHRVPAVMHSGCAVSLSRSKSSKCR